MPTLQNKRAQKNVNYEKRNVYEVIRVNDQLYKSEQKSNPFQEVNKRKDLK